MYAFGYTEVDIAHTEVLGGCIARCKPPLSHKDTWLVDFQLFVFLVHASANFLLRRLDEAALSTTKA